MIKKSVIFFIFMVLILAALPLLAEEQPSVTKENSQISSSGTTQNVQDNKKAEDENLLLKQTGQKKEPVICTGDIIEYLEQGQIVEGKGNVTVTYKDTKLTCDYMRVNINTKDVDAKGNVKLYRDGGVSESEVMHYNFGTKLGTSPDVKISIPPWYGKTNEAVKIDEKNFRLKKTYMTTCSKEIPHYKIKGRKVCVYPEDKVVIYDAVFCVGNTPLAYTPYYSYSLKDPFMHIRAVGGRSREWGHFVLTATRYRIDDYVAGRILADFRELKGHAWGAEGTYNTQELDLGKGEFMTYYMPERDKLGIELIETERYRARIKHTWQIDNNSLFLGEIHKQSDETFVKDYFWREYEEYFEPDSYASLTNTQDAYSINFLVRKRINRFYGETERLPEINLNIRDQQIFDTPFYYKGSDIATNFKSVSANTTEGDSVNRFYSNHELSYPTKLPQKFGLDWLNFRPYFGTTQSYYSRTLDATERDKIIGQSYSGWDLNTRFYRTFGLKSNALGVEINELRHIVTPSLGFSYVDRPTTPFGSVLTDETERAATASYSFVLENRLQTKRYYGKKNEQPSKVDLLYMSNTIGYPVHYDSETRGCLTDISTQFDIFPYRYFSVTSDSIIDQYQRTFTRGDVDLIYNKDELYLGAGSRWTKAEGGQITYEFKNKLNRFWNFRTYGLYDRQWASFIENEYTITRDLHCWLLDVTINKKKFKGNTIWFVFRLKAFPEQDVVQFSKGYHQQRRSRIYGGGT